MLELILAFMVFGLGAAMASFYIAQIYRIENELRFPEFVTKGSFCEKCDKQLVWHELIPIISYLIHNGKCSKCGYKVPITYPLFEFVNGMTLLLLYMYNLSFEYFVASQLLFFLAAYDFYFKGFPKQIMHAFLGLSVIWGIYRFFFTYEMNWIVIVVGLSVVLAVVVLNLLKRSFGVGDLLIVLMMSFVFTLKEFVGWLFFSIILAGVFALTLLILKKVKRKDTIPFVPFMHLAFLLVFILEPQLDRYFTYLVFLW